MSETVLDVLVAGAGPAGVAAGIEARTMGLSTLVVDKATFPRDKTCGDGLTTGALRLLDRLGFDVRTLPSWAAVTDTVIVSPSGREVVLSLPPDGAFAGVAPASSSTPRWSRTRAVEVWRSTRGAGSPRSTTTTDTSSRHSPTAPTSKHGG